MLFNQYISYYLLKMDAYDMSNKVCNIYTITKLLNIKMTICNYKYIYKIYIYNNL
jgi:hypothetical protein